MPEPTFQDPSFRESGSFVLCHSTDSCLEAGTWQVVSVSVPPASGCASTQLCFQNGGAELHSSQGNRAGKRHRQGSPRIPLGARGSVHACLPPPAAELTLSNTEVAPSQNTPSSGLTGSLRTRLGHLGPYDSPSLDAYGVLLSTQVALAQKTLRGVT